MFDFFSLLTNYNYSHNNSRKKYLLCFGVRLSYYYGLSSHNLVLNIRLVLVKALKLAYDSGHHLGRIYQTCINTNLLRPRHGVASPLRFYKNLV